MSWLELCILVPPGNANASHGKQQRDADMTLGGFDASLNWYLNGNHQFKGEVVTSLLLIELSSAASLAMLKICFIVLPDQKHDLL